jgi:thiosulfate/3-mercaptopyruvate sulfurtransferase
MEQTGGSVSDVFVTATWLNEHLDDGDVVIVDVRQPFFYAQAHIPGAVSLPLVLLLSGTAGVPNAETLAGQLGRAGITRESHVVAYDEGGSSSAARLYWLLTAYGHPRVSVLDGGVTAWRHSGLDWEYVPVAPEPADYPTPQIDAAVLSDAGDVLGSLGADDRVLVDTRSPAEYLGLQATALRNGHIPGAINIDWSANFRNVDGVALLQDDDSLRALYGTAGLTSDKFITVYCASGMRASQTFAVLRNLGYPRVSIYLPGWNEWGNWADTPVDEG